MRVESDRRFRFDVPPDELWAAMAAVDRYREWWPWLRALDARGLTEGDVWRATVQPPLPYALRFSIEITEVSAPHLVRAVITGEIHGEAQIDVVATDGGCEARLVSQLAPAHPFLQAAARLARPIVRFGHDWVLDTGARQFRRRAVAGRPPPA